MDMKIKQALMSHYFEGALLILFGAIMLLFPQRSISTVSIISGIMLLLFGMMLVITYVLHHNEKHTLELFAGLMCAALGVEFVFRTSNMFHSMHAVLSITLIYSAILLFLQGYDLRNDRGPLFFVTIAFAVLALVFAVLMLINDEHSVAFLRIKGVSMIIEGIASLFVIKNTYIKD